MFRASPSAGAQVRPNNQMASNAQAREWPHRTTGDARPVALTLDGHKTRKSSERTRQAPPQASPGSPRKTRPIVVAILLAHRRARERNLPLTRRGWQARLGVPRAVADVRLGRGHWIVSNLVAGDRRTSRSKQGLPLLLSAIGALSLSVCGEAAKSDPETASCNAPAPRFGETESRGDHDEVTVRFTCEGATQAGTVYLPTGEGPHPAVVWVHGDGPKKRLDYGPGLTGELVKAGMAILTYDKRGVGESQGLCCPGDEGHFNLLAADAIGAVNALRAMARINPREVGLIGGSQAGWIVPTAAARSSNIAFTALVDGPTVSQGEELLYSVLTGEEGGAGGVLSKQAIYYRLKQAGPSGFDPFPFLNKMNVPGLWLYGGADRSIPVDRCEAILDRLRSSGKDFTVMTFLGAGHGLLDSPPSDPRALPTLVQWLLRHVHAT
jgi:dienelactone hydrolase